MWNSFYVEPREPNKGREGLVSKPTRLNAERGDTPSGITATTPKVHNNTATSGNIWTAKPNATTTPEKVKDPTDYDIPYCSCFSGWEGPKCDKKSPTLPPLPPYTGESKLYLFAKNNEYENSGWF